MPTNEDEVFEMKARNCLDCTRNTLLPYEYNWTCIACEYNIIKRIIELTKIQRQKTELKN